MVAQCPIIPGTGYTYTFTLEQPGTYWYHSHSPGQYMDGLRGPLIVNDPSNPYKGQYDSEIVMWVSDWYHDVRIPFREVVHNINFWNSKRQI